jgi:hypothetical protein
MAAVVSDIKESCVFSQTMEKKLVVDRDVTTYELFKVGNNVSLSIQ